MGGKRDKRKKDPAAKAAKAAKQHAKATKVRGLSSASAPGSAQVLGLQAGACVPMWPN